MAALLDVEGLREKIEFSPGFCCRGPGGSLFRVFWNRFSINIKFEFTTFGPVHSFTAARANFWYFVSLFRAFPF